jgi:hypothetical protein
VEAATESSILSGCSEATVLSFRAFRFDAECAGVDKADFAVHCLRGRSSHAHHAGSIEGEVEVKVIQSKELKRCHN